MNGGVLCGLLNQSFSKKARDGNYSHNKYSQGSSNYKTFKVCRAFNDYAGECPNHRKTDKGIVDSDD